MSLRDWWDSAGEILDNPVVEFAGEVLLGADKNKEGKTDKDKLDEVHSFMETQLEEANKISASRVTASAGNTDVPPVQGAKKLSAEDLVQMQVPDDKRVDFKLMQEIAAKQKRIYQYEQFLISAEQFNSKYRREQV
tara:strand:+ start:53 stop:460 length:408 start_codon:yes stop_codon:yes gene_type:complete